MTVLLAADLKLNFRIIGLWLISAIILSGCKTLTTHTAAEAPSKKPTAAIELNTSTTTSDAGRGAYLPGDGPGTDVPANIATIADAIPRAEPLHRYANRPYVALGKTYRPLTQTGNFKESGIASWYGKKFHGQRTSIGEIYDMYGMTAAHPTLPIPSYARVTNLNTNKSVILRINDRGPFLHDRVIDLSYAAAYKLELLGKGSGKVVIESLTSSNQPIVSAPTPLASEITVTNLPPTEMPLPADANKTGKVFLQLGAFGNKDSANSFIAKIRDGLLDPTKTLSLDKKHGLTRVHYGPYATAEDARSAGANLTQKLGVKPFVSIR